MKIIGKNLITGLNNTNWELTKKIPKDIGYGSKFKNRIAKKRKPTKTEELQLFFKDGVVIFFYKEKSIKEFYKYKLRNNNPENFMELYFLANDSSIYDVTVFNLSDKKLILQMSYRKANDSKFIPVPMGRHIFYRK